MADRSVSFSMTLSDPIPGFKVDHCILTVNTSYINKSNTSKKVRLRDKVTLLGNYIKLSNGTTFNDLE